MRVKGNVSPNVLDIESYRPMPGYVEARLRENINEVTVVDEMTEQEIKMFEYDEYTFIVREREGLREDIETNMADWLATGRALEVNENASVVQDMRTEIANTITPAALDAAYREGVNSI